MKNIKFYYLEDEYEPEIIMIDENKRECYSINRLDLTSINKNEYPSTENLNTIISESKNEGYDGSWDDIKFILDEPNILENLVYSKNRDEYIISLTDSNIIQEPNIDILIERFWERFENQPSKIAEKYIQLYDRCINYLKSLNAIESKKILEETNSLSNKEYFYLIIKISNNENIKINENHFSF